MSRDIWLLRMASVRFQLIGRSSLPHSVDLEEINFTVLLFHYHAILPYLVKRTRKILDGSIL